MGEEGLRDEFEAIIGVRVPPVKHRRARRRLSPKQRRILTRIFVCVLVPLVVFTGYTVFVVHTEFGLCNRLTARCHHVPVEVAGEVAGYAWPRGTKVLRSEANAPAGAHAFPFTSPRSVTVTLELGAGKLVPTSDGWAWNNPRASLKTERYYGPGNPRNTLIGPPHSGLAGILLREAGATHIIVLRQLGDLTVATGMRDGHRLVALDCLYSND